MADGAKDQDATDEGTAAKDAFRDALERKRGKQHLHEEASQADAKIHGTHGSAGGKRTFRRKSGG